MRSVFTVKLEERSDDSFPGDDEIIAALRGFGWEPRIGPNWEYFCALGAACAVGDRAVQERERRAWYREQAETVFKEMPELDVTDPERNSVIYFGRIADEDTVFTVTRRVMGELKFRLLHKELLKLQSATDRAVRNVLQENLFCGVVGSKVTVYERGRKVALLTGQVISNQLREAYKRDSRDIALTVVPLVLFLILIPLDYSFGGALRPDLRGVADRVATAMLTTAIVSGLGFLTVYWRLGREGSVVWDYGH
jgi:hypothetical protein